MKERILVVEDDSSILMGLCDLLEGEGFSVERASDGVAALSRYAEAPHDLILLDVMIPERSGFDVCREIRKRDPLTPIIMLTAKGEELDKVVGLELGADDYVVKPFAAAELLARVRARLRGAKAAAEGESAADSDRTIVFADVSFDPKTLKGKKGEKEFPITTRELRLMRLFSEREGEALERGAILDLVWGIRYEGTTRTLDQHIAGLRKKIEDDPSRPRFITTVHGVGYRFNSKG